MVVYAGRMIAGYAEGLSLTQRVLAKEARVSEETVSRWMQRQDFLDWLEARLTVGDPFRSRQIKNRIFGQAVRGSERHQRLWFELNGELGRHGVFGEPGSRLGDGWVVNIGVPMTPAPDTPALPAPIDVITGGV